MQLAADPQRLRALAPTWTAATIVARGAIYALAKGMDRVCVVVLAASRARLFTFEPASRAGGADERFIEARDLMTTGPARADFSRFVVDQIVALARTTYARRLIICASPEVAGEFYDELDLLRIPIDVVEVDLVEVTRREIRQHLAARRLLP